VLDDLAFLFGVVCLGFGVLLLHDGISNPHAKASVSVIAGAVVFSVGLTTTWLAAKNWMNSKRRVKADGR